MSVESCELPEGALLLSYCDKGAYADCYTAAIATPVSCPRFVHAFYSTWLFSIERWILALLASKPSTAADLESLTFGDSSTYAAWTVERRTPDQLLMEDFTGATRSWFMTKSLGNEQGMGATLLYFGSAVVPRQTRDSLAGSRRVRFMLLLGFHRFYSKALLRAAHQRLMAFERKAGR